MDRLGPFTSLIRSLWRSRTDPIGSKNSDDTRAPFSMQSDQVRVAHNIDELKGRLRARLVPLKNSTTRRRCEVFVETVLLWELNDSIDADPRFAEIVGRVAQELANDPRVHSRLEELLTELPASSSA
jgi:hypothetical protein